MINIWLLIFFIVLAYGLSLFLTFYFKNRKNEYEFTSIVNHTFRTPLTRINWISKELERIDLSREEKLLYIQNLNNATGKLLEIVDLIVGVKYVRNASEFLMKETSFRNIVEKSIEKYQEEIKKKNIIFKVSSFSGIPFLVLDINKISFVIDTMIENAIVYTPQNGRILIDCIVKRKRNKLLFFIGDTGMGLSLYEKIKIFSIFFRGNVARLSNPDGMGLRLFLAKQIVERHNGKIYAKSKGRNKGSVFFIELPVKI